MDNDVQSTAKRAPVSEEERYYREHEAAFRAFPPKRYRPINVTIRHALLASYAARPRIARFRQDFVELGARADLTAFDSLHGLALGMMHADYLHAGDGRAAVRRELGALAVEGRKLRQLLARSLRLLVDYGVVARQPVKRQARGYAGLALELVRLAKVHVVYEAQILGKTPVSRAQLDRASTLSQFLLQKAAQNRGKNAHSAATAAIRQAAFTMFVLAYEEVRSTIWWLRRNEGDGPEIMPSLFLERSRKRKRTLAKRARKQAI